MGSAWPSQFWWALEHKFAPTGRLASGTSIQWYECVGTQQILWRSSMRSLASCAMVFFQRTEILSTRAVQAACAILCGMHSLAFATLLCAAQRMYSNALLDSI